MPPASTPKKATNRFAGNESGNFSFITATAGVMVLTAVGLTVDVVRSLTAQAHLSNAVDAAVLSTTSLATLGSMSEAEAEDEVTKFLLSNFNSQKFDVSPSISKVQLDHATRTMTVSAYIDLPTAFLGITGIETQRVSWTSQAAFSNRNVEIAMALDTTTSMDRTIASTGEKKIDELKDAATNAIDALIPNAAAKNRVRVGLVPYARTVNAGPVISRISTTGAGSCVYERTGPNAYNDTFANGSNPVGSTTSNCAPSEIMPLTNDSGRLRTHINSLDTAQCTAGHTAIAWAHYMLSPNWNRAWDTASEAAEYTDTNTRKYAIIMTDGEFNTHLSSGNACNSDGEVNSRADALALCTEIKKRGITVYTIAFAAPSSAAQMMRSCATPNTGGNQHFFEAADGNELDAAFQAIVRDIQKLLLTR